MENYADRKRGFDVGVYKSTVNEQFTHYEKPMECGNHEDVRWAKVMNGSGAGLMALCDSSLLQVSMLPYSDEEMEKVEYRVELPQSSSTVFNISYRTLGVGSASCGPRPLPQYIVYAAPCSFTYKLQLL
jgi:beta-galactosidase